MHQLPTRASTRIYGHSVASQVGPPADIHHLRVTEIAVDIKLQPVSLPPQVEQTALRRSARLRSSPRKYDCDNSSESFAVNSDDGDCLFDAICDAESSLFDDSQFQDFCSSQQDDMTWMSAEAGHEASQLSPPPDLLQIGGEDSINNTTRLSAHLNVLLWRLIITRPLDLDSSYRFRRSNDFVALDKVMPATFHPDGVRVIRVIP